MILPAPRPCGNPVLETLKQRWHYCDRCGLSAPRDQASGMEILRLGLSLVDITQPIGATGPQKPAALADGVVNKGPASRAHAD